MPAIVSLLALLSLVPLVVLAAGAIGSVSFVANRMLVALVDYVAVMLAFTGGTHWGLGLWPGSGRSPMRLTVAVLPMLVGWVALIAAQFVSSAAALIVLIAGYLATMLSGHQAAPAGTAAQPVAALELRWRGDGDAGAGAAAAGRRAVTDFCLFLR
jgi:hypothetical protein